MHFRCLNFFRDIKTVCHPTLSATLNFDYIDNDSLPDIAGWVLTYAALGYREIGRQARFKPIMGRIRSELLLRCSVVFRKALDHGVGWEETRKVDEDRER